MNGVLGFIRWGGLNRAQSEGMNNWIKLLLHRAFGLHTAAAVMAMYRMVMDCPGPTVRNVSHSVTTRPWGRRTALDCRGHERRAARLVEAKQ